MKTFIHKKMTRPPILDDRLPPKQPRKRDVLLLNPFYPKSPLSSYAKHILTPSLTLTSIAGATSAGWTVRYWDENLLQGRPPYDPFPELVGISVHLAFSKRAYELSNWYRRRGAFVVLGGPHVQSCPEEVLLHADAIVIGNGMQVWPQFLKDFENHQAKRMYQGSYHSPYANEPPPRREILPEACFLSTAGMIATRGCKNRCGFCYLSTKGLQMPFQYRPPSRVAREFQSIRRPYGVFIDNNLGSNRAYLRDLCRALGPIKKIWSAAVSLDITNDPQLVREMALSGCIGVFVGFESLNNRNLKSMGKLTPAPEEYAKRVNIFHDVGIQVNGSFVFGFDHDKKDVFDATVSWIESAKLECATFHILTPYPGTPLYNNLDAQGRILHKNWEKYDTAHTVFQPRHMTPGELEQGYRQSYKKLFSHTSIWRRRPAEFTAVMPYLCMAYLYKRSNLLWYFIIKHRLTAMVWHPLVSVSRIRHLRFRKKLAEDRPVHAPEWGTSCIMDNF
jgi:radical SAM superfamily enzyme YgiQ (UPF0313 family)